MGRAALGIGRRRTGVRRRWMVADTRQGDDLPLPLVLAPRGLGFGIWP
uniref:Uncharacterized protein n=1 Tax=Arundo donax TaxID=35708 RepID=A0A0A9B562_ARUDO